MIFKFAIYDCALQISLKHLEGARVCGLICNERVFYYVEVWNPIEDKGQKGKFISVYAEGAAELNPRPAVAAA